MESCSELLNHHNYLYIAGAGSRAKTLKGYLDFLYPGARVVSFLVDSLAENDSFIDRIPVLELRGENLQHKEYPVFIATKGIRHKMISEALQKAGMKIIIPVTPEVDNELRNQYVRRKFGSGNRKFVKIEELVCQPKIKGRIYVVRSICDKPLQTTYVRQPYEREIQAGAALTRERLQPDILTDCEGDNISAKNRQYCELTVLYWLWKHAEEDVIGMAHYRRHFILPDNWMEFMQNYDIDVILPVPTYVSPNVSENYKERHDAREWDYLMAYLCKNSKEDYETACEVFQGNLYLPCNMFILKKAVLNELCSWLFPILDAVVIYGGKKEDDYLNRYPGFLSERLITLFFYKYKDRFKIVYADKSFQQ